jgi:hypothetical protein
MEEDNFIIGENGITVDNEDEDGIEIPYVLMQFCIGALFNCAQVTRNIIRWGDAVKAAAKLLIYIIFLLFLMRKKITFYLKNVVILKRVY